MNIKGNKCVNRRAKLTGVPVEKLIEIQNALFMMWMIEVDDYLQIESSYEIPISLRIKPGDEANPSLIESLSKILSK
ncbi:hypothetical protein C8R34_11472 [Nitrosomonas sp. Nm84]|uniref:hypothetical protein n=1 Tax=Nitrosomonas sp. Nm84 TaxID=200124 RepID=UPI000D757EF4|nr:hypothetical protein [Nitrosomonas sp. Nm84]PXW86466.1 hypothetical protein C8R34_11472 [Nitrosomonas sp. Nm84]